MFLLKLMGRNLFCFSSVIGTTTAIILGTIAAAGIGVSVAGQRQQAKSAEQQIAFQREQAAKQAALAKETAQAQTKATKEAKRRKRGILKKRTATILTSPQGALSPAETFGKTLLGS